MITSTCLSLSLSLLTSVDSFLPTNQVGKTAGAVGGAAGAAGGKAGGFASGAGAAGKFGKKFGKKGGFVKTGAAGYNKKFGKVISPFSNELFDRL